ncbi:pseudouridine synthase, RluA family [Rubrobacter radiotolerans]|uniref:Pseudouridine synthase n=1 Tax=Rubrobacter radiotolerans TaxID=42256 RepID=A0A023X2T4_RUBRA|nr:RluA family pseudouridine synthase [Rubrobacter radiotolerans]AHY46772.1 pseudouridine synthase, RluA family [Rubrobacter radiotolerans]MDX5894179.1 RluA family pseudouridine synthase [Rubrobacter radiotolerans]SMC05412.1 ribosomal large subunit pseudouridine synthase D [Rubrobacter radiotolerans DSM 5868]
MEGGREKRSFVAQAAGGERLDRAAAEGFGISRSAARRYIEAGLITVDGAEAQPSHKLRGGETVRAELPSGEPEPESIPVEVVYEDEALIVVNKPAGLVVHPGAGNPSGTLVNALLGRGIAGGEDPLRPGIVHRLDRDTSGLMVVAKNEEAYAGLVEALSRRKVGRVYRAVVEGVGLPATGTVDSPVGRDPENPTLMAAGVGKSAVTHFERLREARHHTMLQVRLETGRTHQIRVHLSAIGYPVHADPLYGEPVPGERLWLHAERLEFLHPVTGESLIFEADLPDDLVAEARKLGLGEA